MSATATEAKAGSRTDAPAAESNGAKVDMTHEELMEALARFQKDTLESMTAAQAAMFGKMDERVQAQMTHIAGEMDARMGLLLEESLGGNRFRLRQDIEDELKAIPSRTRRTLRRARYTLIPGGEGDLRGDIYKMSEGLLLGFFGGRRMGPLPFTGW